MFILLLFPLLRVQHISYIISAQKLSLLNFWIISAHFGIHNKLLKSSPVLQEMDPEIWTSAGGRKPKQVFSSVKRKESEVLSQAYKTLGERGGWNDSVVKHHFYLQKVSSSILSVSKSNDQVVCDLEDLNLSC